MNLCGLGMNCRSRSHGMSRMRSWKIRNKFRVIRLIRFLLRNIFAPTHKQTEGEGMNLKKSIRVAMAQQEMTQAELAAKVGVTASNFSLILNRESIPTSRLEEIAQALDMKVSDLIKLGED